MVALELLHESQSVEENQRWNVASSLKLPMQEAEAQPVAVVRYSKVEA